MAEKLHFINVVPVYPDNEDFTVSEILRQRREAGIDEIALCLSFHPEGQCAYDKIPRLVQTLKKIQQAVVPRGIRLGVLIQSTLGHGWSGRVPLTAEPWQTIVGLDGISSTRMCPLDPDFQNYVLTAIRSVAENHPAFLLMDDDFGLRNHECFCPLHVEKFNRAANRDYTREELEKILRTRPWDDPESALFSRQREETILNLAERIRATIDEIDPALRCGMCAPSRGYGFLDRLAHTLAGKTEPFVRVNNAVYGLQNPACLADIDWNTNLIRHQLSDISDVLAESDTFPQNYYSESATLFRLHLQLAVLNGLAGFKLWTSEFDQPLDLSSQDRYEHVIAGFRPFLERLHALVTDELECWQGIAAPLFRPAPEKSLHPIGEQEEHSIYLPNWNTGLLCHFGFPVRYAEPGTGGIFALTGKVIDNLSDDDLDAIFLGPVLLDSTAAKRLSPRRDFAEKMGVRAGSGDAHFFFTNERRAESEFGGGLMWEGSAAELTPVSDQVRVLTTLRGGSTRDLTTPPVAPGLTLFENACGGRVAVTAWSPEMPFYKTMRPFRRDFLRDAFDFLNGKPLEMSVEARQEVLVRHGLMKDGSELLAVLNLALDPLETTPLRLVRTPKSVHLLTPFGEWREVAFTRSSDELIELANPLEFCRLDVYRFTF